MRIRTYARVRGGTLENEDDGDSLSYAPSAIHIDASRDMLYVLNPMTSDSAWATKHQIGSADEPSTQQVQRSSQTSKFPFDGVFGPDATQEDVFSATVRPLLAAVLEGVNCTLFAYGQTGSGKTYTMTGRETYESRGVVPRALSVIFEDPRLRRCRVSFVEVYNEIIYDLLNERKRVAMIVRESRARRKNSQAQPTVELRGLGMRDAVDEESALDCFFAGNIERSTGSTTLNMSSSRSHCVFSVDIETETHIGRINFVDLAGSERTQDQTSKHINLSLHFLEQVIMNLQGRQGHVGFRNSTMTSLLRDSLTGNCQTAFLVTINPEVSHITESLSTCRFAQRCRTITMRVTSNETISQRIQRLEAENVSLRQNLEEALLALREHDQIGNMLRSLLDHIDENVDALISSELEFANDVSIQVDPAAHLIYVHGSLGPARELSREAIYAYGRLRVDEERMRFVLFGHPNPEFGAILASFPSSDIEASQAQKALPEILSLVYATNGSMVEHVAWLQAFEHWLGPEVANNEVETSDEVSSVSAMHKFGLINDAKDKFGDVKEQKEKADVSEPHSRTRSRSSSIVQRALSMVKQKVRHKT